MPTKTKRQKAEQNLAKAMSHPDRANAFKILSERKASTNEMADELGLDVRQLGYHIRRLRDLKLIEEVGTRQVRGALETYYAATAMPIVWTDEWDEIPAQRRASLVGEFIQAIVDQGVRAVEAETLGQDGDFFIGPTPMVTDREGLQKLVAIHDELVVKALDVQADYVERKGNGEAGEPMSVVSAQACFAVPPSKKP